MTDEGLLRMIENERQLSSVKRRKITVSLPEDVCKRIEAVGLPVSRSVGLACLYWLAALDKERAIAGVGEAVVASEGTAKGSADIPGPVSASAPKPAATSAHDSEYDPESGRPPKSTGYVGPGYYWECPSCGWLFHIRLNPGVTPKPRESNPECPECDALVNMVQKD